MIKIEAQSPESQSADLIGDNIAKLKALFPELLTETGKGAAINVDVLKALVGDATASDGEEKYGLNWHGKRRARQIALTPSTGTLRPCHEESVDWDTTQNLMIEGDNLEVLKLLQKSYAGKVKLIYIDPPYNTGKDFVYPDNFQNNIKNYLELTGQVEGGAKIASNSETSGRFHTDWLNMLYPRLKLARNLMRPDGAIFISIDDGELDNLKRICVEIFGEENFVGIVSVMVNPRGRHLDKFLAQTHDNLLVFVKDSEQRGSITGMSKDGDMLSDYDKADSKGKYRELGLRNRNQAFNPKTRPNLYYPLYVDQTDGSVSVIRSLTHSEEVLPETPDGIKTCWTWGREKVSAESSLLTARQVEDGSLRVYRKDYLHSEDGEVATTLAKSMWLEKEFNNDYGRKSIKDLFGSALMDFPKSPDLLKRIISIGSGESDLVIDFFAGSGTTAHAIYEINQSEQTNRKFILVQLPEPTRRAKNVEGWEESAAWVAGFPTIADLTKERLRRSAAKLMVSSPELPFDAGFRVFKLATSNIRAWEPNRADLAGTLLSSLEHIEPGRSDADVLYEILIKLGLDLCIPIEKRIVAAKTVHCIGGGTLMTCLDDKIAVSDAEALALGIAAWRNEQGTAGDTTAVFRDSAFENDVAKSNLAAILEQHGIKQVRSL